MLKFFRTVFVLMYSLGALVSLAPAEPGESKLQAVKSTQSQPQTQTQPQTQKTSVVKRIGPGEKPKIIKVPPQDTNITRIPTPMGLKQQTQIKLEIARKKKEDDEKKKQQEEGNDPEKR